MAGVAFIDKTLYALIGGAGCSHGLKGTYSGVLRVNADGSITQIANLSAYFKANPTRSEAGEPDGNPFSMIEVNGKLYVVNPNHNGVEEVTTDGNFYVSNLVGGAKVFKITPNGELAVLAPRLTPVLGIAFDAQGQMYALETNTTGNAFTVPGRGAVVRVNLNSGATDVVATGLTFPTAMTFGPDGILYVSNFGYLSKPGMGQVVRIEVPQAK